MTWTRFAGGVAIHPGRAAAAAETACPTSPGPASGTFAVTRPVAGS